MTTDCGCNIDEYVKIKSGLNYCPLCGSFILDSFIGEKFLPGNKDTPLRKLIQKSIYDRKNVKGQILKPDTHKYAGLWEAITAAIDKADFCIFDISEERFNVGYEIGYAIGRRKAIRLCCSDIDNRKNFKLWSLVESPFKQLNDEYIEIVTKDSYTEYKKTFEKISDKSVLETLVKLENSKTEFIDIYNKLNTVNVINSYFGLSDSKKKDDRPFDLPQRTDNAIIITSKKYKSKFSNIKTQKNIKQLKVYSPNEITSFTLDHYRTIADIITKIFNENDYYIGHLLNPTEANKKSYAIRHNFYVGIFWRINYI